MKTVKVFIDMYDEIYPAISVSKPGEGYNTYDDTEMYEIPEELYEQYKYADELLIRVEQKIKDFVEKVDKARGSMEDL